jgi:hypothetical protein
LEKLQANDRKDDVITFEQLGVRDRMFVDVQGAQLHKPVHSYKRS